MKVTKRGNGEFWTLNQAEADLVYEALAFISLRSESSRSAVRALSANAGRQIFQTIFLNDSTVGELSRSLLEHVLPMVLAESKKWTKEDREAIKSVLSHAVEGTP